MDRRDFYVFRTAFTTVIGQNPTSLPGLPQNSDRPFAFIRFSLSENGFLATKTGPWKQDADNARVIPSVSSGHEFHFLTTLRCIYYYFSFWQPWGSVERFHVHAAREKLHSTPMACYFYLTLNRFVNFLINYNLRVPWKNNLQIKILKTSLIYDDALSKNITMRWSHFKMYIASTHFYKHLWHGVFLGSSSAITQQFCFDADSVVYFGKSVNI